MHALTYHSHDGHAVDLYCERTWTPNLSEVRSTQWNYTLGARGITGSSRTTTETTITVTTRNPSDLDRLQALADTDVEALAPGTITVNGEWSQKAFIVGTDVQSPTPSPTLAIVTFRIVLCDGLWRHRLPAQRFTPVTVESGSALDMPRIRLQDLRTGHEPAVHRRREPLPLRRCDGAGRRVYDRHGHRVGEKHQGDRRERRCGGPFLQWRPRCREGVRILTWSGGFTIEFDLYESSGAPPWSTLS